MSEDYVVQYCAPTLAGIKTGSLFSGYYQSRADINEEIRAYNKMLRPKGLCLIPLCYKSGRVLLYLYRPGKLREDLTGEEAVQILKKAGYEKDTPEACLVELIRRLNQEEEFPHEIGLFLSYPPEDVRGFIENRAKNCRCVGTWKVYGDEEKAKRRFRQYEKCTDIYCKNCKRGFTLDDLAVSC
ncbi:MAG: DUF3793 family protein [Lachnospiraceae bacterium]|nr:DUF3793 family protein [Lachnospiraceae bacterium]